MPTKKDPRFNTLEKLFKFGQMKAWKDISVQIPPSVMREVLHTNHYRMKRIYNNPAELQYDVAATLADLIGVEHRVISELIEAAIKVSKTKTKKG